MLASSFLVLLSAGCAGDPVDPPPQFPRASTSEPPDPPDLPDPPTGTIPPIEVTLALVHDPTGYAPLSAELQVEATAPVTVEVRVPGVHGPASDVVHETDAALSRVVPVHGLYPERAQQVEVVVRDEAGAVVREQTFAVETPALPAAVHQDIEIVVADLERMAPGLTLVSAFGRGLGAQRFPTRPVMFDAFGDVRWILDFAEHPRLGSLFYDVGVEQLANGNLYFGDTETSALFEVDRLGRVIDVWPLAPYRFHHNVLELPNGNFLATASLPFAFTMEDQILEIDRETKEIVHVWDLRTSLDPERWTWSGDGWDWAHVNAVQYDATDDCIVISARYQGVVKLDRDNEVVWILAPHVDWRTAGDGTDLSTRLLQPLGADGNPILDDDVLRGDTARPDFDWNWYQHAVEVLGDGEIALFDNGENRHFRDDGPYSRAVRYRIDEDAMTVRQVWTYGEARGAEMFSSLVSDVDVRSDGHVIWSPGAVRFDGTYGAVVELDENDQVVFEAKIHADAPTFGITFHRTERLLLHP